MKAIVAIAYLSASVLLGGCSQYYVPMMTNVPLLSQPGEVQGALHVANNGYNAQIAYSPVPHLGLIAGGNTFSTSNDTNDLEDFLLIAGEIGGGYYTRLSRLGRLEAFAGVSKSSTGDGFERWYMRRYFFQASAGLSAPLYDAGISARLSWVDHYSTGTPTGQTDVSGDDCLFIEPSLTLRAGYENFKFSLQGGLSFAFGGIDGGLKDHYKSSLLAFGIQLCFGKDFSRYE